MMASCGPAFRNSLANMAIRNSSANTIRPAMTNIWFSINGILLLILQLEVAGQFIPRTNVGDALFIPGDHDFGAFRDGGAGFGTCAGDAARATLCVNQFPGS